MPKKTTKAILALVKKAGISIESDELDKLTTELEDNLELSAEEFLGTDQVILSTDDHRELKDDLTKLRTRMKTAEQEAKDLREAMDSGDSDNVRKAAQYKKKLDELEPVLEKLLTTQKDLWATAETRIPNEVKDQFKFAEKDKAGAVTKELTTDELIHNITKFEEYTTIGVIKGEGEPAPKPGDPPKPPTTPKVGGKQGEQPLTKDQMGEMKPAALVAAGYKERPAPSTE